ncbi:MAG: HAD family hydrolase [Candidatus Saccharimonadaceae bacterium]
MYKLLLLDVDGTLVASKADALPSQKVIEAISRAQEKIAIGIVTGRPYAHTKAVIDALGLKGIGVFNGGAEIINLETGENIFRQSLSIETARQVLELVLPYGYALLNAVGNVEQPVTEVSQITEETDKLLVVDVPTQKTPEVMAALDAVEGIAAHPVSAWSDEDVFCISIVHEHASKRYGAERIMKLLGYDKSEVLAVGDGHNDLPLIEAVGLGIAMGNAPEEVKQLAGDVTNSLEEDGVARVIEKYILN